MLPLQLENEKSSVFTIAFQIVLVMMDVQMVVMSAIIPFANVRSIKLHHDIIWFELPETVFIQDVETNFDWNICIDDNGAVLGRCVHACNGAEECETECLRTFKVRQSNCPCEENCKGGCPCENFTCMDTSTTSPVTNPTMPSTTVAPTEPAAVLALNNFSNKYKPMVIGFDGKKFAF